MIQEYLFMDTTHRAAVESYAPAKVQVDIYDIENSTCWTVTYSLSGGTEESARLLSQVNEYVLEHFKPTVLTNESAAYFNQRLYPYVNEFERKLRKLLYLKSAIYSGSKKIDNIRDLETKDLGTIFELLFADPEFVKNARQTMKEKSWLFTKREILSALQDIAEDTVWDNLLGKESVKLLRDDFVTAKNFRNDVMHAHDISAKTFREARKLFSEINAQLDVEIGRIIQKAEDQANDTTESDFNDALSTALQAQNLSGVTKQTSTILAELMGDHPSIVHELSHYLQNYYSTYNPNLKDVYSQIIAYQMSPEYDAFMKRVRESNAISTALKNSIPIFEALRKETEKTSGITRMESGIEEAAEEEDKNADA